MATNNASNQKFTNNADGFDIAGGTTARKLTVSGADIAIAGSGTNVMTMPAATDTLVGRASTDTLTNKTLTSPVISGAGSTTEATYGYDASDHAILIGNGTSNLPIHVYHWKVWTPTFTNITTGSGTKVGAYCLMGKTCFYRAHITFAADTSVAGSVSMAFPVTINAAYSAYAEIGRFTCQDNGGLLFSGVHYKDTGLYLLKTDSTIAYHTAISSTVPMTWAVNDVLSVSGMFEIA